MHYIVYYNNSALYCLLYYHMHYNKFISYLFYSCSCDDGMLNPKLLDAEGNILCNACSFFINLTLCEK